MGSPFNPFESGGTPPGSWDPGGFPTGVSPAPTASSEPLTIVKPPTALLAVAAAAAVIGAAVTAIFWGSWITIVGWTLAGPVAIGVMAFYLAKDTSRRAEPVYLRPDWITMAYAAVAVLAVVSIVLSALGVAFWVGRL